MSEISDAAIVSALRRHMDRAVARQVAAAGNLANIETPGYRARDAAFAEALDGRLADAVSLSTTDTRHLPGTPAGPSANTRETDGLSSRRDGNNVQLDRELMNLAQAGGDFAKAQTALAAKFRLVRYAISGGQ